MRCEGATAVASSHRMIGFHGGTRHQTRGPQRETRRRGHVRFVR